eukprot:jgi/Bigna1/63354/fgenesh1_kg.51_\
MAFTGKISPLRTKSPRELFGSISNTGNADAWPGTIWGRVGLTISPSIPWLNLNSHKI